MNGLIPKFTWRHSTISFESLGKGKGVIVTNGIGNILNGILLGRKVALGLLHSTGQDIVLDGSSGCVFKQTCQIASVEAENGSDTFYGDLFIVFQLYILNYFLHIFQLQVRGCLNLVGRMSEYEIQNLIGLSDTVKLVVVIFK